ncbi:hypothetical protein LTS10_002660 [Elasticomyces elasticus]|nr:hypothetical protein LTS10_002660 [Elasticomyces elasticus]
MLSLPGNSSQQVALLVAIVGLCAILHRFYRASCDELRGVPGPPLARFTRAWELLKTWQGDFEKTSIALHKRYGSIVRVGPNRYSISDPTAIRPIYGAGSKFSKSDFYLPFGPPMLDHKDVFSEMDNAKHAADRKKISNMYSMSGLASYEPYVDKVNAEFMARMDDFAERQLSFDLFTWMQYYAFDVIGEITLGKSFGLIDAGNDKDGLLQAVDTANTKYAARMGLLPEFHIWYLRVAKALALNDWNKVIQRVILREISSRMGSEKQSDREDFLAKCVTLLQSGKIGEMDMNNVIGMNIGAGSDTTGISLSATIYHLIQNPRCMERLREELKTAALDKKLSHPVTFRESQNLPYLQAVIKEALRMHPAVGTILPRVVPQGGVRLAGTYIPQGVSVTFPILPC